MLGARRLCRLAICAGVARATSGGGDSIATAPVVTAGVQEDGNTASFADKCGNKYEYWALQLKQGDLVKITWGEPAAVDTLALWAPGTTDAANNGCLYDWSHWTASPVLSDLNDTAGTTHLAQTVATEDGSYPLLFLDTTGAERRPLLVHRSRAARGVRLPSAPLEIPGDGTLTAA